jgi:hypothetical protein
MMCDIIYAGEKAKERRHNMGHQVYKCYKLSSREKSHGYIQAKPACVTARVYLIHIRFMHLHVVPILWLFSSVANP